MEDDDDLLFRHHPFSIDADAVCRSDAGGELETGCSVDLYAASLDQLLATTA